MHFPKLIFMFSLPNRQAKYDPWHLWYDMVCQVFKIQIMIAKYSNLTKVLGSKPHHDFEITTRKYHYYRHWLKVDQYGQAAFNASPFQWGGLSLCTHDWNLFAFSLHISQSGNPHERQRTLHNQYQKARIQSDVSEMEKKLRTFAKLWRQWYVWQTGLVVTHLMKSPTESTQCDTILHNVTLFYTMWHCSIQCDTILYNVKLFYPMWHYSTQCKTILYNVTLFYPM